MQRTGKGLQKRILCRVHILNTFNDANKEGYYRIAAIDFDGSTSYSDVEKIACNISNNEVSIWPNPTTASVFVKLNSNTTDSIYVSIYDSRGGEISTQKNQLIKGENKITVDLNNLAAGVYWLKMNWNNGTEQKSVKVIKQ